MALRGSIARSAYRTSVVLAIRLLAQAGTLLLLARLMGPADFGIFAGATSLAVMLGSLATVGTHLVMLGELSRDSARRNDVLAYAIPVTLAAGSILLFVYMISCSLLFPKEPSLSFLAIGLAEFVFQPLLVLSAIEHLASGRAATSQFLQVTPLVFRMGLAGILYVLKPDAPFTMFACLYLVTTAGAFMLSIRLASGRWPNPRSWRLLSREELRNTAGYAAMNVTAIGPAELDKTLATQLMSPAVSGVYATAARVVGATTLPVAALTMASLPRLFRGGSSVSVDIDRFARQLLGAAAGYGLLLAGILWLAAPILVLLFGSGYQDMGRLVRWLCLAVPGMALRIAAGSTLMAMGRPWMRFAFEIVGLAVLTLCAIFLTRELDAIGMALALACAEWAMVIAGLWSIRRARRFRSLDRVG